MPTVLLVRHAENDFVRKGRLAGRMDGVHLNERGREQALALARALKDAPVKAVYCSPLERAVETGEPIARELGLPVIERPGLLELDYGEWENKTLKALRRRKLWKTVQNRPSLMRFPDGESFSEAQLRAAGEIDALCQLHNKKDLLLCVSHSDLIRLALAYYLGLSLDLFQRLVISPASISTLHLEEGQAQLLNVNYLVDQKFKPPARRKGKNKRGKRSKA